MTDSFPIKILLIQLILYSLCLPLYSQQPANEANEAQIVQKDNFVFKPSGMTFPNWEKKPEAVLRFSLENSQKKNFNQLKGSEIKVLLDGNPVTLTDDALTLTESNSTSVYILLDGSLSMLGNINEFRLGCLAQELGDSSFSTDAKSAQLDKLEAAKSALISFVGKLKKDDSIGIYAFDSSLYEVVGKTTDKEVVKRKISNFLPRCEKSSNNTELYGSIEELLVRAGGEKIENMVIVSDGMQDTAESKNYLTKGFSDYKAQKESKIRQKIVNSGTRVFTIPIGDADSIPKDPKNLSYVDKDTLCQIGDKPTGGDCEYIDLPKLKNESETSGDSYQSLLENSLKSTLEKIRSSFRFGYELKVPINTKLLNENDESHKLNFDFPVGNIILPYEQKFRLRKPTGGNMNSIPEPEKGTVGDPILIAFPSVVQPPSLFGIYVSIAGAIGLLGLLPSIFGLLRKRKTQKVEENYLESLIKVVDDNSPYRGTFCPNKHKSGIQVGEVIILCPNCKKPHHLRCWELNSFRCYDKVHCSDQLFIPQNLLDKYEVD